MTILDYTALVLGGKQLFKDALLKTEKKAPSS